MGQFARKLASFSTESERKINRVFRRASLDVLRRLIIRSPVDTGRFRGNWQTGVDEPPDGTKDIKDKAGTDTIMAGQSKISEAKVGQSIFIVNNLPYALPLENGHSQQAPYGMVGIVLADWDKILRSAVNAEKRR